LTPFEAMLMISPVLSFELNIGNQVVYKPGTQTYIDMTKKKLELTQRVIDLNMADANKISAKYYDRTAVNRTFKKGERVWLHDTTTKKGEAIKLKRPWRQMLVLEKVSDLNYRVCDAYTGKVMNSPVHIDRLMKMNVDRDHWFTLYPENPRDQTGSSPQDGVTNTQLPTVVTPSQLVSTNGRDNSATQSQTKTSDPKLPDNWYHIDRILSQRVRQGVTFFRILWSDKGPNGEQIISWEPKSGVTSYAVEQYRLALDAKRKLRRPRKSRQ
jgi:hypothetical protein